MATDPTTIVEPQDDAAPIGGDDFYNDRPRDEARDDEPALEAEEQEGEEAPEQLEEQPEPIVAPKSWSKEDRDGWDAIPRAQQEIISRRETERDKHLREVTTRASQTEQRVQAEARQAYHGHLQVHAQQLEQYAAMFNPEQPDLRLLNSDDPSQRALYFQQEAQYRQLAAHREQANRQANEARQQMEALQQHEQQLAQQEFHQTLTESVPEWSDPSERANLLAKLGPIAAELGYSAEVQSGANATDILALRKALGWKADADKYRALMKQKMVPVREAKGLPPTSRTPAPPSGQQRPVDDLAALYPNDQPRR